MNIKITTLVTDVDGVLTNGKFYYSDKGKLLKEFGPHDGDGAKILRAEGIEIKAITADLRGFQITKKRLDHMGIQLELVPEKDRLKWMNDNNDLLSTAFIGDGLYDIPVMKDCVLSFAPNNALDLTKKFATITTKASGGEGVLLEVAFEILKSINKEKYEKFIRGDIF